MPPEARSSNDKRIRVVTWNCHGSVGRDRRCDRERTIGVIRRLQPDILALQEVDGRAHLGRRERAFEFFEASLGGPCVEARTVRRTDRDYGHLLWSRWPILDAEVIDLPGPGLENRALIDANVETPTGRVRVLAFHLGLIPFTRRRQARFIAERFRERDVPTIAMGDGNDWRLAGALHRQLDPLADGSLAPKTWPATWPLVPMDRVYWHGLTKASGVVDEGSAGASDHRALVVDLTCPAK